MFYAWCSQVRKGMCLYKCRFIKDNEQVLSIRSFMFNLCNNQSICSKYMSSGCSKFVLRACSGVQSIGSVYVLKIGLNKWIQMMF